MERDCKELEIYFFPTVRFAQGFRGVFLLTVPLANGWITAIRIWLGEPQPAAAAIDNQ